MSVVRKNKSRPLSDLDIKRITNCVRNKINFISGTVTPAQSNKIKSAPYEKSDIECIDIGLKFLFDMYDNDLVVSVQPKYMGSRFNIYLFRNDHLKKSYGVTRNGFMCTSLSREVLTPVYDKLHKKLLNFMTENKVRMMIIDGELLPWSALGSDLIENKFLPVDKGLETEIEYAERYGFYDQIKKLTGPYEDLIQHLKTTPKKDINELINKFGEAKVKDFERIKDLMTLPDSETTRRLYKIFNDQMRLYGEYDQNQKPHLDYKPFGILKICFDDGSESIPLADETFSQSEMFDILRFGGLRVDDSETVDPDDESQLVVHLTHDTFNDGVKKIKSYFNNLTCEKGYEGVVIKPDYIKKDALPMMKCRNTSYLSIIYGFDYTLDPKLSRLIKSKSTASKIKQSIREFNHGLEMLKIKYDEIDNDNQEYQKIVREFLFDEELGNTIDPRL